MHAFRGYSVVGPDGYVLTPPGEIQSEADARLIASAPDLLAALQEMRGWFAPELNDGLAGALGRADAAIAKAIGTETP